ncbi:MFS transporter [Haliea atlantica]|nr:MFS transporter [Haliea sp.]MAL93981.1 MFS transporter [Haliea sp.]|tara:strand:+ start:253195 stop:254604 length:1410 start_codon:yes stop_codon:yes gene_type:complete
MRALLTLTSLLISTALLLIGQGMQLTLLPLRASTVGMADFVIGVSASCYFLGFVGGSLVIPRIIAKVGHIRSFAVLTAIMISAILALEMLDTWPAWMLLRFLTGAVICGLYTVIESWLNDQTNASNRGQVLAIYTFIILVSMAVGQVLINIGPADSSVPFTLAAIFLALAIVPVGLTSRLAPAPVAATRVSFRLLYRRSRTAFAGTLLSGLVVGSFWSLGAVFAQRYGQAVSDVTLFITAGIAGGALFQYPIGWLSDRVDRRYVLFVLGLAATAASAAVALSVGHTLHLLAVFFFGATTMPMYALSLATAADNSSTEEFVKIGTAVLMLNALGAASAPVLLGQLMDLYNATALFWSSAVLSGLFAIYLGLQTRDASQVVAAADHVPFSAAAPEVAPTGFALDPRGPEEDTCELMPEGGPDPDEMHAAEAPPEEASPPVEPAPAHRESDLAVSPTPEAEDGSDVSPPRGS